MAPSLTGSGGSRRVRLRVVLNGQRPRAAHARSCPPRAGACAGDRGTGAVGMRWGPGAAAGLEQPLCAGELGQLVCTWDLVCAGELVRTGELL